MNTDKAYILGLIIGGATFSPNGQSLLVELPFKQWGSMQVNPARVGQIVNDIMSVVNPLTEQQYGITISRYDPSNTWKLFFAGDTTRLVADLRSYGIRATGKISDHVNIRQIADALIDDNMKRRFIAGLADTIGSTVPSHRRFSQEVQILSFEIPGFNYDFVCILCQVLSSVQCYPDQILWNHPNMHSGKDPYYSSWKKGNKLRVSLDQYAHFGAFAFRTKAESSNENRNLQHSSHTAESCQTKVLSIPSVTTIHPDENSTLLPEVIRGGHYIHHKHICAALGCPNVPHDQIQSMLADAHKYISPFALLHKGSVADISQILSDNPILSNRTYRDESILLSQLLRIFDDDNHSLLFHDHDYGYHISTVIDAVTFLIAANSGNVRGKRPIGSRDEILASATRENPNLSISIRVPDYATPLILTLHNFSAMVGAYDPSLNRRLISFAPDNRYKMRVREVTEGDLSGRT